MLPTFIVIGAGKSGTTSLHRYLGAHPQVFTTARKELDFFIEDRGWPRGLPWYEQQFAEAEDAVARGESSPRYTLHPDFPSLPHEMAGIVPRARLIYIVRDPLERAISAFRQRWRDGRERLPIARALEENPFYLGGSMYGSQIERYLAYYPREQILILRTEDLLHRREETVRRALRFIGVDDSWTSPEIGILHNRSEGQPRQPTWAVELRRAHWYGGFKRLLPARLRRAVTRLIQRRGDAVSLDVPLTVRERLRDRLADDMARFRQIAGEGFDAWDTA